jgi:uncharacterized protein (TIGR03083 family)
VSLGTVAVRSGVGDDVVDVQAVNTTTATVAPAADRSGLARTPERYQRTFRRTADTLAAAVAVKHIPDLRIELGPAADAIERAGRRVADLLRRQPDPGRRVTGLEWSIGETGAHLAARLGRLARLLAGSASPQATVADIARENDADIRERAGRALLEHVDELETNVAAFVAATRGKLGSDPMPWYSGATIDVATAAGLVLGELVVHGFDVARTVGARWPISAADARTILRAGLVVAPLYVDARTTAAVSTTFRLLVRGGPACRIQFEDGTATIQDATGAADCTIRADPVALLLVSYGRSTKWRALATGKLLATGRRPWAALRFDRYFVPP